jgi:hypothetical protein
MPYLTTTSTRALGRRFGRRRMLAVAGIAGTALAMGGLTACTDDGDKPKRDTSAEENTGTDDATDTDDADAAEGDADEDPAGGWDVFAIGETAVYDNLGVKFTLQDPETITPDDDGWDDWGGEGFTGYAFTLVVENNGDKPYDADMILFDARAGEDGVAAEQIYSIAHLGEGVSGTALPGNKVTGKVAFNVPDGASPLIIELKELNDWDSESAYWSYEF